LKNDEIINWNKNDKINEKYKRGNGKRKEKKETNIERSLKEKINPKQMINISKHIPSKAGY